MHILEVKSPTETAFISTNQHPYRVLIWSQHQSHNTSVLASTICSCDIPSIRKIDLGESTVKFVYIIHCATLTCHILHDDAHLMYPPHSNRWHASWDVFQLCLCVLSTTVFQCGGLQERLIEGPFMW